MVAAVRVRLLYKRNYAKSADAGFRFQDQVWRDGMADHGEVEYATATGNDYPAHEQTYNNFITLVKVTMAIVIVIVIGMAYFLT
jgi:hypothetical protein